MKNSPKILTNDHSTSLFTVGIEEIVVKKRIPYGIPTEFHVMLLLPLSSNNNG